MFAYCLNNPGNGCDPCGNCFHHWKFWTDCEKCKQNNTTKKVVNNILDTTRVLAKNLEFSAGIGQGMYAEFEVLDIGVGIGMYGNYMTINYSQGEWDTGAELYHGISTSITPWLEVGAAETCSRDSENNETCTRWLGINDTQETWTIFSAAFYPLFIGGSIHIGFDMVAFCQDVDSIWRD